jgi:hypothetical protein
MAAIDLSGPRKSQLSAKNGRWTACWQMDSVTDAVFDSKKAAELAVIYSRACRDHL